MKRRLEAIRKHLPDHANWSNVATQIGVHHSIIYNLLLGAKPSRKTLAKIEATEVRLGIGKDAN